MKHLKIICILLVIILSSGCASTDPHSNSNSPPSGMSSSGSSYIYSDEISFWSRYPYMAITAKANGGFMGYIDEYGEVVIEPDFQIAEPFQDGFACVCLGDNEYFFINTEGKNKFGEYYDYANSFSVDRIADFNTNYGVEAAQRPDIQKME